MADSSQHNPTPWRLEEIREDGRSAVVADNHTLVIDFAPRDRADAEFIVRAVNNHDALVAALKTIERRVDSNKPITFIDIDRVRTALAEVRGTE